MDVRPLLLRRRADRPQLKRDPLGSILNRTMQLLDFRPGQVRVVREITEAEYASYRTAARHLRDFGRWRTIITMASANRDQFARSLAEAAKELESHQTLDQARRAIDFSLNRHLLNFLGAMLWLRIDPTESL